MPPKQLRVPRLEERDRARSRNARTSSTRDVVEVAVGAGVDDRDLLLDRQRLVLRLLQDLDQPRAAIELRLRRLVEVAAELRERRELAVLREVEPQRAGDLPHRLDLRRAADARHRVADVDRRADALVEQVRLEEDLAVGDRDDVGRNVGRQVAGLRLDDRQRRQRSAAELVVQLRRALEQARVQIEDVARDTPRGPADGAAAARSRGTPARASTDRRRRTSAWRPLSRKYSPIVQAEYGRCRAAAPDRTPSRRRRWCSASRRLPRASARPARRSTASGRSRCRCR